MKKTLSLLLALVMLLAAVPAFATAENPVKLDVFYASSRPMNEATNLTYQYMIDNLGVDFNLIQGDSSNFAQQLALYISSGDMPDVVLLDYSMWKEYAAEGAWADLTPYLGENYPDLMEYVGDYWPYVTNDGQIQGIPSIAEVPTSTVTFIRQDWLDNLGLETPVTIEDYTNVMRAFKTQDPDGNGVDDTYGLGGASAGYLSSLMGAFGATSQEDYFLNEDGTITTNVISEGYRNALRYLRDIYAEGLIDPEMFTGNDTLAYTKWGRGEFGIWPAWWSHAGNAYLRYDFANTQPGANVQAILPPVGADGQSGALPSDPFSTAIGISYKCTPEEIEAALRLLNFQASDYGFRVVMFGVEGEFFTWDPEKNETTWTWEFSGGKSLSGKYETTDMEVYKMLYNPLVQNQHYAYSDSPDNVLYDIGSSIRFETPVRQDIFGTIQTEEYIATKADLKTYQEINRLAFIMGEKDIETDWDAYVAEYLSMGGEESRQSRLKVYNETFGTNCTFAE